MQCTIPVALQGGLKRAEVEGFLLFPRLTREVSNSPLLVECLRALLHLLRVCLDDGIFRLQHIHAVVCRFPGSACCRLSSVSLESEHACACVQHSRGAGVGSEKESTVTGRDIQIFIARQLDGASEEHR